MSVNNFIPELWSDQILENVYNSYVFASPLVVNRRFEAALKQKGDTVRINSLGDVTISDYTRNSDHAAPEELTSTQTVLEITQSPMFNFQVDDIDQAQMDPQVMGEAMRSAASGLKNRMDTFLSAMLVADAAAGNKLGSVDVTTPDKLYERLVDLSVRLDEVNCPEDNRFVVLSPALVGRLLKDDRLSSFGTDANRATLGNRVVGNIAGLTILRSNQVPVNTAPATDETYMIAGHADATTLVEQLNEVKAYEPEKRFGDAVKGLHVYGAKVIRPEWLVTASADVTA